MSGTLYIVGTPIGNLKDVTYRAVETLASVDMIACEDTRHTAVLLKHYGISKPLVSYYKQKEKAASSKIAEALEEGKNVALVTDAGMPCVSDPGAVLVKECRERGIRIESVPGPSAVVTAMSVSGITDGKFAFIGFLPDKNADRRELLGETKAYGIPLIFYTAPHDLKKTLAELLNAYGDRRVTVVKELTKIHESVYEGTLSSVEELTKIHESVYEGTLSSVEIEDERGEFVLIVEPDEEAGEKADPAEALEELLASGVSPAEAARRVALKCNLNRNAVYALALKLKNKR